MTRTSSFLPLYCHYGTGVKRRLPQNGDDGAEQKDEEESPGDY